MTAATLHVTALQERLLLRRDEIERQLTAMKLSLAEATDSQMSEGTLANHQADEATDMLRAETDLSRIYDLFEEQRDVAGALARIELGTYGICIGCGTPVDPERLDVIPVAKRCLTCQMAKEDLPQPARAERRIGMEETFRQ